MYEINLKKDRLNIISLFYRYFVLNYDVNQMKQDLIDEKQVVFERPELEKYTLELANSSEAITGELKEHLKDNWQWERLPNLVKAALIDGVFEIKNTTIPKASTIDAITQIIKELQPDWDYKFVNAVLDKFDK